MNAILKPWLIFQTIQKTAYVKSGDDVDWAVYVDHDDKHVWLIFQESKGSFTGRDWQNNFRFPAKLYKKQQSRMRIHRGYGDAWKSCNDEVMNAFIKLTEMYPAYSAVICGWSYGGAMALLAAEDFHFRTGNMAVVVTFGAPKPLWGIKTEQYFERCVSCVLQWSHVNDLIPLLPPFIGYRRLTTNLCGKGFSLLKLFRPDVYHCIYGKEEIYE